MMPLGDRRQPGAPSLVTTSISQQGRVEIFPRAFRVKRQSTGNPDQEPPTRAGSSISGFSENSRRRLGHLAENCNPDLISQLGLTYHNAWPTDGRECKRHLNAFLVSLKRIIPGVLYLWILEFQSRGAPHFHLFLTVPPDPASHKAIAEAWCRITSPDDLAALRFHKHAENWIPWCMYSAGYLTKYLSKEAQKTVPPGYHNFGRFWANSRTLRDESISFPEDDLDRLSHVNHVTGEIYGGKTTIYRWLGRLAEKQTNGYSRFRKRVSRGSYTIRNGAAAYRQIEQYFARSPLPARYVSDESPF